MAMSPASTPPCMSPREQVARIEIGLTSTKACSQLGSVSGSTNTFDRNVSGNRPVKPAFMTAFGERISRPSVVKTQERPKAKTITSASAATIPSRPSSGRKPRIRPRTLITIPATR